MNTASFCDVIRSLLLWVVCNVARHRGGDDERTSSALFEMRTNSFGTVKSAVEIDVDNMVPGLHRAIENIGWWMWGLKLA